MRSVRAAWCPKLCRSPEFSSIVTTFSCTFGHPLTTASPWLRSSPPAETVKPIRAIIRPDSSQFCAISISPALVEFVRACVRANCGASAGGANEESHRVDCGSWRWFHVWLLRRSGKIISVGSLPDGYPCSKPSFVPVVAAVWEVPSTEPEFSCISKRLGFKMPCLLIINANMLELQGAKLLIPRVCRKGAKLYGFS